MPLYRYIAKSLSSGESQEESREAKDELDLARLLRLEGWLLIQASDENQKSGSFHLSWPSFGAVPLTEKMFFARNLQIMISAGLALPRSLEALERQSKNQRFKKTLNEIRDQIAQGKSFSECLAKYPAIFPDIFQSMIKVGEESGTLEEVLKILSLQMERQHDLQSKILGALLYPLVILLAMAGIGVLMLVTVVPQLASTFQELQIPLPLTTQFVIGLANFLTQRWYLAILLLGGAVFLFWQASQTKTGQQYSDELFLRLPVVSGLVRQINTAVVSRNLSSLVGAGVALPRALEITADTVGNSRFKKALGSSVEQVRKGQRLSEALNPFQDVLPVTFLQMVAVGEETGETSSILAKLADFFEEEVTQATKNLTSIIEPVLMLLIGGVVGFFAVSMIQPLYSMLETLK